MSTIEAMVRIAAQMSVFPDLYDDDFFYDECDLCGEFIDYCPGHGELIIENDAWD